MCGEINGPGFIDMFESMFSAIEHKHDLKDVVYDGYLVNAIISAAANFAKGKKMRAGGVVGMTCKRRRAKESVLRHYDVQRYLFEEL